MQVHITIKSTNKKTGPIPVTTTSSDSCPTSCPLKGKGGCYASSGPMAIHWNKVTSGERGDDWETLCDAVSNLPGNQLWRHNQAGDLPHVDQVIDLAKVRQLVQANKGKNGFTYTHHDMDIKENRDAIEEMNAEGLTVNLSADNPAMADSLAELEIAPVVTILPADQMSNTKTPAGRKIVICPAVTRKNVSCATCGLCARSGRESIIGFPAHGSRKKVAASH